MSGVLHEGAAIAIQSVLPQPTRSDYEQAILAAQQHFHALGVTAWQDAWTTPETLAAYVDLARRDALTARVAAALWWERDEGPEQIDRFVEQRRDATFGRLTVPAVKIMVDGTTGNQSAAVLEPYVDPDDGHPAGTGTSSSRPRISPTRSPSWTHEASGRTSTPSVSGPSARRWTPWRAPAPATAPRPRGTTSRTSAWCTPTTCSRFAALDVTANLQPLWAELNDELIGENQHVGLERAQWWYPFESLRRAGARLAGGSDWPVSSADPLLGAYVAVHRIGPGSTDPGQEVLMPHERMSVEDIIDAYTAGSAYVNGLDDLTGRVDGGRARRSGAARP